jgi:hypothetical protein
MIFIRGWKKEKIGQENCQQKFFILKCTVQNVYKLDVEQLKVMEIHFAKLV